MSNVHTTAQSLIGLTKEAAQEAIKQAGYTVRILEEDGKVYMHTNDMRMDRIGLRLTGDKVFKAEVG